MTDFLLDTLNDGTLALVKYRGAGGAVTIPPGVSRIGDNAFDHCFSLTEVTVPEGVTHLGDRVFSGSGWLTRVRLPASLTRVGVNPFVGCRSLASLTLAPGNPVLALAEALTDRAEGRLVCFLPGGTGTVCRVSPGTRAIGADAFFACGRLEEAVLPDSVEEIGDSAFDGCWRLCRMALPAGLRRIGAWAFAHSGLTEIVIPEGVGEIGDFAFCRCEELEAVTLPAGPVRIGRRAFAHCPALAGGEAEEDP